jgi:hypothetical protein
VGGGKVLWTQNEQYAIYESAQVCDGCLGVRARSPVYVDCQSLPACLHVCLSACLPACRSVCRSSACLHACLHALMPALDAHAMSHGSVDQHGGLCCFRDLVERA